ncbi:bifunctional enzyme CysNCysC [Nitrosomonas stercoris]|uniref:sulfate adenylyltransferase n=1 Tax=Nitrosomonas stercoris TaxID=1444684 RepID=A0A4Y1YNH5_9PROT|nr:bifunctional enzyme CysNCysC [Nitrosomonas stercoris]
MAVAENIEPEHAELLRFITAGSVDDGKSTLIGRLLHDSKSIFEDQLSAVTKSSNKRGLEKIDLSLFTDGLQAEREQGITIDVAYRYFSTPKRKFIIADTPGHEQYTRNMVTGASTANLAIILIDARKGVLTQSKRHAYLASLLGIPHLVVAINKMDLVDYSQEIFKKIRDEFSSFLQNMGFHSIEFTPISALLGDMIVERGDNLNWYSGKPLLDHLETINIGYDINTTDFRFPVQWVSRPRTKEKHDFRGYTGRIESGSVQVGDTITILPSGLTSHIKEILLYEDSYKTAFAPQSVTLTIDDHLDISRGDMLVNGSKPPQVAKDFTAMLCWLSEQDFDSKRKYIVKHTTRMVKGVIAQINYRVDINTMQHESVDILSMNDIAEIEVKVQQPLVIDAYAQNRGTGCFILIDEISNNTVAAGMISALKN